MDNPGEILRLCRLCLVKDQVNIPIFAEQGDSREIFLKISSCLPVKVSIEDRLPKKICDGCSEKLNSFYEFWSSSANAEKTLLSWLGEDEVEEKKVQAVPKSLTASATLVKEESAELVDEAHAESIEESTKDESEAPPTKRARRSAAVKAQINLAPDSEDDDLDTTEPLTKMEEESADSDGEEKDPSYTEMPGTSADDEQAGPSGMGKDGVEAPKNPKINQEGCQYFCEDCSQEHTILKPKLPPLVYPCQECFVEFPDQNELEQHQTTCHQTKLLILVNEDENIEFIPHSTTSTSMKILFSCQYCSKRFLGENNLINHLSLHTGENVFQCKECSRCFVSAADLKRHQLTHTGEKPFRCKDCGKNFSRKFTLEQHVKSIHAGEKPYRCSVCGRCFSRRSILGKHLKIHGL